MAASKALRIGVLALAGTATLVAVLQVNERDKRLSGSATAGARDGSLRADTARSRAGPDADAENWLDLLRRLPIAAQTAGELFSSSTWAPPPTPAPPAAKPVDTPPPFPFVYLGKSMLDGATRLFLTRAVAPNAPPGPVFMVSSGETLDGAYRINSVADDSLAVTYLPMNKAQTFTFASLVANGGQPQAPGTPLSAAPIAPPVSQAFVAKEFVPAPASASAPAAGSGGIGIATTAASAASASSETPFSTAAVATAIVTTGSPATVSSAINPAAAPGGALGGQAVGTGILGVAMNNNSPIGFNGAISPGSMPTGSSAPRGPGPVTK